MNDKTATVNSPEVEANPEESTLPVYAVLVERSINEVVGAEVFAYEIPVLRALHGESRVYFKGYDVNAEVEDVEPVYEAATETNSALVLRQLKSKYNQNGQPEVVSIVYRDADELASKMGLKKSKGRAKAIPESENIDGRKVAKKK